MSCERVRDWLWSDEPLDERQRAALDAHLADCADCRAAIASIVRLREAVSSEPSLRPSRALGQALLQVPGRERRVRALVPWALPAASLICILTSAVIWFAAPRLPLARQALERAPTDTPAAAAMATATGAHDEAGRDIDDPQAGGRRTPRVAATDASPSPRPASTRLAYGVTPTPVLPGRTGPPERATSSRGGAPGGPASTVPPPTGASGKWGATVPPPTVTPTTPMRDTGHPATPTLDSRQPGVPGAGPTTSTPESGEQPTAAATATIGARFGTGTPPPPPEPGPTRTQQRAAPSLPPPAATPTLPVATAAPSRTSPAVGPPATPTPLGAPASPTAMADLGTPTLTVTATNTVEPTITITPVPEARPGSGDRRSGAGAARQPRVTTSSMPMAPAHSRMKPTVGLLAQRSACATACWVQPSLRPISDWVRPASSRATRRR